jgi:hypothetical protein
MTETSVTRTQPKSRQDHIVDEQEWATKAFKDHVIRSRDARSWVCYKPHPDGGWDSIYWFEAVVLHGGTLLVTGDIDLVHFAYYGKGEPEDVLRWMGACKDVGHYVLQKATIGMTLSRHDQTLEHTDRAVWLHDALDYIKHNCLDGGEVVLDSLLKHGELIPDWLVGMVEPVVDGTDPKEMLAEGLDQEAYEAGAYGWGLVPTSRVIYAHAALTKLVQLLDAEHSAENESSATQTDAEPTVQVAR